MRHRKHTFKIGRTSSHRRCMLANMLKSLVHYERIETTLAKAKELRRYADHIITLAKENSLVNRRRICGELMVRFNSLSSKEARLAKKGEANKFYNIDRTVVGKLFGELSKRFALRKGGYTRIVRLGERRGDNAATCLIEYLPE